MDIAALITWLLAAVLGFTMLGRWLAGGGVKAGGAEGGTATTRFSPGVVFGHFLLAAGGLVVWIWYLVAGTESLTWVALAALVVVALLGLAMFIPWLRGRGSGTVESRFPTAVVAGHGLFAVATAVLVLLVALNLG